MKNPGNMVNLVLAAMIAALLAICAMSVATQMESGQRQQTANQP